MAKRVLLVSTLDSNQPFGSFTRPFHLGEYLSKQFKICQLGLNCTAVNYAPSVSVGVRSLKSYIQKVQKCIDEFQPDIIYAQETLPGLAALISLQLKKQTNCSLVLDFHTFSAFEYWTRLSAVTNPVKEFLQFIKTYVAQGILVFSGKPIIAAGEFVPSMISKWYGNPPSQIHCVGNGVTEDLLNPENLTTSDPYSTQRPAKIVAMVAPRAFQFPSNDMAVAMTVDIARQLESHSQEVQFVVVGRDGSDFNSLPSNITFTGFLPDRQDFIAHLRYADIGLLPFPQQAVAGGARNKALDYFASQKLVISTPEGMRGLEEFQHNQHLLITDYSPSAMGKVILDAVSNMSKYQPLIDTAHALICQKYSWNAKAEAVAEILMSTPSFNS